MSVEDINIDIQNRFELIKNAMLENNNAKKTLNGLIANDMKIIGSYIKKYEKIIVETKIEKQFYKDGVIGIEKSFVR